MLTESSTILLVEDDSAIVDATTLLLETRGLQVVSASDADEAFAKIDAGVSPHIVVTDFRMPGLSGIDLIEQLRERGHDCPCILMTGDASAQEITSANIENCTVLSKPVDPHKLLDLLDVLAG